MSIRTDAATARRSTVTKAVASVGILAAAAAVAGLGSFGTFTDSTTPVQTNVDTGVLSISLSPGASTATVPVTTGALLPGDSTSTPFDLINDGDVAWESVSVASWATRSSLLDSDRVHGLQLELESCASSWVADGASYSCADGAQQFYSGPIVNESELAGAYSLAPGRVDHLLATISFPTTGGDRLTNLVTDLSFQFTAVQRDGTAR
ncbi:UNVERIFIED_ORG: hypothetical protein E4P37_10290 [Bacillus sp. AZ43]